jgi:hypothetical protein
LADFVPIAEIVTLLAIFVLFSKIEVEICKEGLIFVQRLFTSPVCPSWGSGGNYGILLWSHLCPEAFHITSLSLLRIRGELWHFIMVSSLSRGFSHHQSVPLEDQGGIMAFYIASFSYIEDSVSLWSVSIQASIVRIFPAASCLFPNRKCHLSLLIILFNNQTLQ